MRDSRHKIHHISINYIQKVYILIHKCCVSDIMRVHNQQTTARIRQFIQCEQELVEYFIKIESDGWSVQQQTTKQCLCKLSSITLYCPLLRYIEKITIGSVTFPNNAKSEVSLKRGSHTHTYTHARKSGNFNYCYIRIRISNANQRQETLLQFDDKNPLFESKEKVIYLSACQPTCSSERCVLARDLVS